MNIPPTAQTRVIHHLDAAGRVVAIQWEPATHTGARRTCVIQTHELVRRTNELLHHIQNRAPHSMESEQRRAGYRQAIEDLLECDELQSCRAAVADLRPYLAIMARAAAEPGMLFPTAPPATGLPDAQPQPQRRRIG